MLGTDRSGVLAAGPETARYQYISRFENVLLFEQQPLVDMLCVQRSLVVLMSWRELDTRAEDTRAVLSLKGKHEGKLYDSL